jgi:hypothetical protein
MIARDENILGLDVAMNDSLRMRVSQCIRNFAQNFRRLLNRQLPLSIQQRAKIFAADERHRVIEERPLRSSGEKWNDVRMLQSRGELNLTAESIGVDSRSEVGRKNFHYDLSLELSLGRYKYTRHPCPTELTLDAVRRSENFLKLGLQIGRDCVTREMKFPNMRSRMVLGQHFLLA